MSYFRNPYIDEEMNKIDRYSTYSSVIHNLFFNINYNIDNDTCWWSAIY